MILDLIALRCPPPDQPQSFRTQFGSTGGLIGRGRNCTLALPDPSLQISRKHVEIRCRNGEFGLKVVSDTNGVLVNDILIDPGAVMPLADGDRFVIGDYLFEIRIAEGTLPASSPFDALGLFDLPTASAASPGNPWASLAPCAEARPPATASDRRIEESLPTGKLADMLGQGAGKAVPGQFSDPSPSPWSDGDINKLLESLSGVGSPASAQSNGLDPELGGPSPELFRGNPLQQPLGGASAPAWVAPGTASTAPVESDIFNTLKDFAPPEPAPIEPPPRLVRPPAELVAVPRSASPRPTAPVTAPAQGPTEPAPGTSDGPALVRLLTQALGLQQGTLDETRPESTIQVVGELLRLSVGGVYRMLEMRSQLRGELGVEDRTTIKSRENNPLKQTDSLDDALTYLVDVRQHGNKLFMPPARAVEDATWDICAHEMALMAGTRAALLASLKLFSPNVVESRIKTSGALDMVLPGMRKSRLWDLFLEMYNSLEREAEDHFDRLLNDEFVKAYGEQNKKLRKKTARVSGDPAPKGDRGAG